MVQSISIHYDDLYWLKARTSDLKQTNEKAGLTTKIVINLYISMEFNGFKAGKSILCYVPPSVSQASHIYE
jgi:hypothetical protein